MTMTMNEKLNLLTQNLDELLKFLKPRYHLYHLSNIFFRDLHYGIMSYLELRGIKYTYAEGEELTRKFIDSLERSNILRGAAPGAWTLNYPEFRKPPVKPAAPAKPAASAAASKPSPAAAPKQAAAPGPPADEAEKQG